MPSSKAVLHDLAVYGLNPAHAHTKLINGRLVPVERPAQVVVTAAVSVKPSLVELPSVPKQEEVVPVEAKVEEVVPVVEVLPTQTYESLPLVVEQAIASAVEEKPAEETIVIASSKKLRAKKAEKPAV